MKDTVKNLETKGGMRYEDGAAYSLLVQDEAMRFGISRGQIYNMVSDGTLARGQEYLKVGRRVLILENAFKEWLWKRNDCAECAPPAKG